MLVQIASAHFKVNDVTRQTLENAGHSRNVLDLLNQIEIVNQGMHFLGNATFFLVHSHTVDAAPHHHNWHGCLHLE